MMDAAPADANNIASTYAADLVYLNDQ